MNLSGDREAIFLDKLCCGILNTHIIFSINLNAIFALKVLLMKDATFLRASKTYFNQM